jgi:uncharacterized protein YeaO (DUF488 family)
VIRTKRVYDAPAKSDGERLLVMRLWPRGVRKDAVDAWEKELAPSRELLRSYQEGGVTWAQFARAYRREMTSQQARIDALASRVKRRRATLLCGCAEDSRCHRSLLRELVETSASRRA